MTAIEGRRQAGARRERRAVAVLCALLVAGLAIVPSTARRSPRPPSHPGIAIVSVGAPAPAPVATATSRDAGYRPSRAVVPRSNPVHRLVRLPLQRPGRDGAWVTTLPPPALPG